MSKADNKKSRSESTEAGEAAKKTVVPPPPPLADPAPEVYAPEDQYQRWLKYGANVVLMTIVVLLLAGIAIWASTGSVKATEKLHGRKDLSSDPSNQLKPQTIQLIKDLPADREVTLVSLYPKLKKEEAAAKGADTYGKVQDILDEYQKNGANIKTLMIDPINDPNKLGGWLEELKRRYGSNLGEYEKVFKEEVPKAVTDVQAKVAAENKRLISLITEIRAMDPSKLSEDQVQKINATFRVLLPAAGTMQEFVESLSELDVNVKEDLKKPIPDYAQMTSELKSIIGTFSKRAEQLVKALNELKGDKAQLENVRKYIDEGVPALQKMKTQADELLARVNKLGELKLTDIRDKVLPAPGKETANAAIVVMGPDDVRVIDDFSLWKSGAATGLTGNDDEKPKLRFAGEQQVTSAILGVSQKKKQKVAFVRAGGEAKTTFGRGGPPEFGVIADRLKSYNFDVIEKDFNPPDPRMGPPPGPDVSEDEIKDAIWVVFASPPDPRMMQMGLPPTGVLGEKLKAHLDAGGSALCLVNVESEDLAAAMKDWGIEIKPNVVITHEKIKAGDGEPDDFIEQARRQPFIFVLNQFGDHPIASSIRSLDAAFVPLVQVKKAASVPAGTTVSELIPIPTNPKSWGETDMSSLFSNDRRRPPPDPTFDPATDVAQPVFAGAAAEKQGKGRLVVIGTQRSFMDDLLTYTDPKLKKNKTYVSRFPGNGELFTNSIFWLARNEKMIALSPSAMDTTRIESIPEGKLGFLRVGLVMITLPLLAVAAGIGVWMTRRG